MSGSSEPLVFDVRSENTVLNESKRRYAVISICFAALLIGFALTLLVAGVIALANSSQSMARVALLLVGGTWAAIIAGLVISGLRWRHPGAESIVVDSLRVELRYQNCTSSVTRWKDPGLRIELRDYVSIPGRAATAGVAYTIYLKGSQTALNEPAFRAIMHQISVHGLPDSVGGPRWWSADTAKVHRVRGN